MKSEFGSYFLIGVVSIFVLFLIFALKDLKIFRFALKQIKNFNKLNLLLLIFCSLSSIFITSSLLINDTFSTAQANYLDSSLGITTGVIYNKDKKGFSETELKDIYSNLSSKFRSFLTTNFIDTELKLDNANSKKVSLINFNSTQAEAYDKSLFQENINWDLKDNEALISESFAKKFNLEINDSLKINHNLKIYNFIIKQITKDNGLTSFNPQIPTSSRNSDGSIFISKKAFFDITNLKNEGNYILLNHSLDYERKDHEDSTQKILNDLDTNFVYEEIYLYNQNLTSINSSTFNLGQLIFIFSLLPIILSLLIFISILNIFIKRNNNSNDILLLSGIKSSKLFEIYAFQLFFYSIFGIILGMFVGTLLGFPIIKFAKNLAMITASNLMFFDNISLHLRSSTLIYIFSGTFIIIYLISLLTISYGLNYDFVKSFKEINTKEIRKITFKQIFIFLSLFAASLFLIKIGLKIPTRNSKIFFLFIGLNLLINLIFYLLSKWKNYKNIFLISSIVSILYTIFFFKNSENFMALNQLSYFPFVLAFILIINFNFFFILATKFKIKIIQKYFTKFSTALSIFYSNNLKQLFFKISLYSLFTILIFSFLIVFFFEKFITDSSNNLNNSYDIIINERFDDKDLRSDLKDFNLQITKFNSDTVNFPDYKYKDLEIVRNASEEEKKNLDFNFELPITVLDNNFLDNIEFENKINDLNNEKDFVILGPEFSPESKNNQLPNIKIGDKLKIRINKNLTIERKVVAIISKNQEDKEKEIFIKSLGNNIFLTDADYQNLKSKNKIYFPATYGIKLKNKNDLESLSTILSQKKYSNKIISSEVAQKSKKLFSDLLSIIYISITILLVLLSFYSELIFYLNSIKSRISQNLYNSGLGIKSIRSILYYQNIFKILLIALTSVLTFSILYYFLKNTEIFKLKFIEISKILYIILLIIILNFVFNFIFTKIQVRNLTDEKFKQKK